MEKNGPQEPRRENPPRPLHPREPGDHGRTPEADRPSDERQRADEEKRKPSAWETADKKRRTALVVRLVLGLTLLVLFVLFVTRNSDSVPVDFIFTTTQTPLVWVFLVCALVGALVAYLLGRQGRRSSRKYIKELERKLEERGDKR